MSAHTLTWHRKGGKRDPGKGKVQLTKNNRKFTWHSSRLTATWCIFAEAFVELHTSVLSLSKRFPFLLFFLSLCASLSHLHDRTNKVIQLNYRWNRMSLVENLVERDCARSSVYPRPSHVAVCNDDRADEDLVITGKIQICYTNQGSLMRIPCTSRHQGFWYTVVCG